jgi:hypothetical protein
MINCVKMRNSARHVIHACNPALRRLRLRQEDHKVKSSPVKKKKQTKTKVRNSSVCGGRHAPGEGNPKKEEKEREALRSIPEEEDSGRASERNVGRGSSSHPFCFGLSHLATPAAGMLGNQEQLLRMQPGFC